MPAVNEPSGFGLLPGSDLNALAQGQNYANAPTLTAAGSARADATQLQPNALAQRVGTTAASTGVCLYPAVPGSWLLLDNDGANTLAVYALGSDTINGTAGSTGVTQATGLAALYFCATAGVWSRILTA